MNRLEIPERAVDAALAENTAGLKSDEAELIRLEAAAPIIVAAHMRHLADIYPGGMSPDRLRNEAQRLDPEGGAGG
jgi:hypothetical protein